MNPKIWIHLTDITGQPCSFRADALRAIHTRFDGKCVVVLGRTIVKVHHPAHWEDDEIKAVCEAAYSARCAIPCKVGLKGERLVDIEAIELSDVHVVVQESVEEVQQKLMSPSSAYRPRRAARATAK